MIIFCVCGLQQFDLNSCVLEPWDKLVLGGWICRDRFLYGKVRSMNVCFYSHWFASRMLLASLQTFSYCSWKPVHRICGYLFSAKFLPSEQGWRGVPAEYMHTFTHAAIWSSIQCVSVVFVCSSFICSSCGSFASSGSAFGFFRLAMWPLTFSWPWNEGL